MPLPRGTGVIPAEWLLIFAIALSLSYVIAAPLTQRSPDIYDRWNAWFHRFESGKRLSDDLPIPLDGVHYIVIGMNHLGHAVAQAYEITTKTTTAYVASTLSAMTQP